MQSVDETVWEELEFETVLAAAAEVMSVEVKDGVVVLDEVMVKSKSEVVDDSDAVEIEDEVSGESIVVLEVAKISK